jgi:hypothetical protein
MKTILATLVTIFLGATTSYAIDWIIVPGATRDGDIVCLDRDNVTKDKTIISAWLKRFKEGGNYTKTLVEFDCTNRKTKLVTALEFDKASNTSTTIDYEPVWEVSSPDTPVSAAAKMICKKGKGINPALVSMKTKQ